MKYDIYAKTVGFFMRGPIYKTLKRERPTLLSRAFKRRLSAEYKAIIERTAGLGGARHNPMEVILYFLIFLIAVYKVAAGQIDEALFSQLIDDLVASPFMKRVARAEGAFSKKTLRMQAKLATQSQKKAFQNDWVSQFEHRAGSGEYFITYRECGICKVAKKEGVFHLAKHLCKMDYALFAYKNAVLDRTKTLADGDDCCNFHIMTPQKAAAVGFKIGDDAK